MAADTLPEQAVPEIFLGRQPILDRAQVLFGYELLFRSGHDNHAEIRDARGATADVVCKAFAELGLADALGTSRAFVIVDRDLLADDAIEFLPPGVVVLEIQAADILIDAVDARCQALRERGYEIAASGVDKAMEALPRLRPLAAYLKVDTEVLAETELKAIVARLKGTGGKLVACRVESQEMLQRCVDLGFDYFQGYYFDRPVILEGRKLDASIQGLLNIINLVNTDAEAARLEAAFKHEPGLTVNLLRLVNSVGAGMTTRIASVRHAITVMGRRQLARWLQLLVFANSASGAGIAANPLMQHAALRGYFMELLAPIGFPTHPELREQAFLVGLMSLMPAALGMPMTDILDKIAVAQEVRLALSRHDGQLGTLLALTERYDDNDMPGTAALLARLGGRASFNTLSSCLAQTIAWVQQLGNDA
ncbi:MAG: HDOD domain-containing protein [Rhodocyclaceae bacterium]|nr:HDOD domain-containing protein [Rhodocyclaceae bacterium]